MYLFSLLGDLYRNIVPFTILLGILVFVHELGHFLVARFCGVRVEVFSLGFGKKILSYKHGDTVYCLSLIPLGGYVKMFGEQGGDEVPADQQNVSFTHKSVWKRIAIVLAGPLMNLFFAILVFGIISFRGEETRSARIADIVPGSAAETAGLLSHDKVLKVNDAPVRSYEEFQKELNSHQNQQVQMTVIQDNDSQRIVTVAVKTEDNPNIFAANKVIGQIDGILPYAKGTLIAVKPNSLAERLGFKTGDEIIKIDGEKVYGWTGLQKILAQSKSVVTVERDPVPGEAQSGQNIMSRPSTTIDVSILDFANLTSVEDFGVEHPDLYLEQIVPDSPAAAADIQKYDKIISINSKPMTSWDDVLKTIKTYDEKNALEIKLLRNGTEVVKKVTPKMTSQMTMQGKEDKRFTIGIMPMANIAQPEIVIVQDNIFGATMKGWERSWDISVMTVMSFVRLFQGEVSHKNIGGLISIGKAAKDSYAMGFQMFLQTMGILSISLFILNLLPVPVLDGGHLVFYGIEVIKGSPLSIRKMEIAHQIGFGLLMCLMVLALFNDVTKFLF
jgi:regulator of sigma E protease